MLKCFIFHLADITGCTDSQVKAIEVFGGEIRPVLALAAKATTFVFIFKLC